MLCGSRAKNALVSIHDRYKMMIALGDRPKMNLAAT